MEVMYAVEILEYGGESYWRTVSIHRTLEGAQDEVAHLKKKYGYDVHCDIETYEVMP